MSWVVLTLVAAAYAWAVARAGRWPLRRTVAFAAALAALGVALSPGMDRLADHQLSWHMAEHGLISMVAAPLVVAAAPVSLLVRAQSTAGARTTMRAVRRVRALAHPLAGLALFLAVGVVSHLPAVYDLTLRVPAVHALDHAAFFWSAVALWVPLVGADPLPRRLGLLGRMTVLLVAMTAMGVGGALLASSDHVVYPGYEAVAPPGVDPVSDQQVAGGVMWVGGAAVMLPLFVFVGWRALDAEERRQRARDLRDGTRV